MSVSWKGFTLLHERVRTLRKEHGMSLRQLAEAAGVSAGLLSQIERGTTDPSLTTIRKLASVFGADLATLFAEDPAPAVHVSRPHKRPGIAAADGHITYERLTPGRSDLEVLLGRLAPGEATSPEHWSHASVECAVVTVGSLTAQVAGVSYDLQPGESITFDSRQSHRYINNGSEPAEFFVSITPPMP